jgi:hypothetical protein
MHCAPEALLVRQTILQYAWLDILTVTEGLVDIGVLGSLFGRSCHAGVWLDYREPGWFAMSAQRQTLALPRPTEAPGLPCRHRERSLLQLQSALAALNASPLLAALSLPPLAQPAAPTPAALQALVAEARAVAAAAAKHAQQAQQAQQQLATLQAAAEQLCAAVAGVRAPFEWVDGPLVEAMKRGDIILVDELNLAEDAVLERLNRWAWGDLGI